MKRFSASFCAFSLVVLTAVTSFADDARFPPTELVKRAQTNSAGVFEARGAFGMGFSAGSVGKPVVLAPSLYYAITDDLELGLDHHGSLCLSGCKKTYNDVGLDGLYSFLRGGPISLSAHAGVYDVAIDPDFLQARAGVLATIPAGERVAFYLDPQLFLGVTKRDAGNKEVLSIPFRAAFQTTSQLALFVDSGFTATLADVHHSWVVPIAPGAFFAINRQVDVGAKFSFDHAIADVSTARARTATLFANFRF